MVQELDAPEPELTAHGEQVLAALTTDYRTTRELEAATGLANSTVDRELKGLVYENLAETAKAGRSNANAYRLP